MLQQLLPSDTASFLERFQNFYDAVLRHVTVDFTRPQDNKAADVGRGVIITLSVPDWKDGNEEQWVNVVLDVEAVRELDIREGSTTSVVLSSGLSIGFFDGAVYLAIDEDADSREDFLQSAFHVVGERLSWSVEPYREQLSD
jgi:hypothetical protein